MAIIDDITATSQKVSPRIVLAEGKHERVVKAALQAATRINARTSKT